MPRRSAVLAAAALLAVLVASAPAEATGAHAARKCKSADLRYPFMQGLPNDFGVFKLRITGGRCRTAHRVAKEWMRRFEANIRRRGRLRLPRSVLGFTFETLPPTAAQTYRERGRKGDTTIRFNYRVPNG